MWFSDLEIEMNETMFKYIKKVASVNSICFMKIRSPRISSHFAPGYHELQPQEQTFPEQ